MRDNFSNTFSLILVITNIIFDITFKSIPEFKLGFSELNEKLVWCEESLKKKLEVLREAMRQEMWFKVWSLWLNSTELTIAYWKKQLSYCIYLTKKEKGYYK